MSKPKEESFPARIEEKIRQEGLVYKVKNGGQSGDASSDGIYRLSYWLSEPIDVFVLELGINDIIRGTPPNRTKQNLDEILRRVRQKFPNCKLVIMGMEAPESIRTQGIFAFSSANEIKEFKSIFRDLANSHKATLIPFFLQGVAGVRHLNLPDGLHPNGEGYKVIADHAWQFIRGIL